MNIVKKLWRKFGINPFDTLLKRAQSRGEYRFLICWNRGLGDIPLGLCALTHQIRTYIPHAEITFLTRSDLADGFKMLPGSTVVVDPDWKRGVPFDLDRTLLNTALVRTDFDCILERPDPTYWVMWQLGTFIPKLSWNPDWDALCHRFCLDPRKAYVGVHVQTQTHYSYEKNWPIAYWKEFFKIIKEEYGATPLLFGFASTLSFEEEGVVDLRGKTSLFEMLSIVKNRCRYLVAPDSGVLSLTYYIDAQFPLDILSLWADPKQGILKQNVRSPNTLLRHTPLIAAKKDLGNLSVESAVRTLFSIDALKRRILAMLEQLEQPHLAAEMQQLSVQGLQAFFMQLQKYSPPLQPGSQFLSHSGYTPPCRTFAECGNPLDQAAGEALLQQGKVGCLILAGGQGTRLGVSGPKGTFPVTPVEGKSLFQLFCERTKQASLAAGKQLPLCIMTSPFNHAQTVAFFEEHAFFGLDRAQITFFEQEMLPLLDDAGKWLLEEPGKIAEGPDGNGHALHLFFKSGIWNKYKEAGIEYLNVIFVDNALADPFDPECVGFAARTQVDAVLKAVGRLFPEEKMGALVEREGKLKVLEYSEIPAGLSALTLSSTGMFCLQMDFIAHLCQEIKAHFPLHRARKSALVWRSGKQEMAPVWKCERFLFDLLDYARSSAALVYPRAKIYAPLKNASGDHSPESVRQALLLQKLK